MRLVRFVYMIPTSRMANVVIHIHRPFANYWTVASIFEGRQGAMIENVRNLLPHRVILPIKLANSSMASIGIDLDLLGVRKAEKRGFLFHNLSFH
jgi:hypothetical protein